MAELEGHRGVNLCLSHVVIFRHSVVTFKASQQLSTCSTWSVIAEVVSS